MNDIENARLTKISREKYPAERERLIVCFEKEKCPECGKGSYKTNKQNDGFCSNFCYKEYLKKDPMNESNLKQAQGEFFHKVLPNVEQSSEEKTLKKVA